MTIMKREVFSQNAIEGNVYGLMMTQFGELYRKHRHDWYKRTEFFGYAIGPIVNGEVDLEHFPMRITFRDTLSDIFAEAFRVSVF